MSHEYLFVYGTLLRGLEAHDKLPTERARFAGEATISGRLYNLGPYPALRVDEPGTVRGELYEMLDPALICDLDIYEGYHGRPETCRFLRCTVEARMGSETRCAWAYAYNPRRTLEGALYVKSGDYRRARIG